MAIKFVVWLMLAVLIVSAALETGAVLVGSGLPRGTELAFWAPEDGAYGIFVADITRGLAFNLSKKIGAQGVSPAWSPDGNQIAFTNLQTPSSQIFVMDAVGRHLHPLTTALPKSNSPAWSPDGTRIAFVSDDTGISEIYSVHTDGTNLRRLTESAHDNYAPVWSPDGTHIAFSGGSGPVGASLELYVIDTDGSHRRQLTNNKFQDGAPAWSPDGGKIAFVSDRDGNDELYIMNADGSDVRRMTHNPDRDIAPNWSPHGDQIAFMSGVDAPARWEVYMISGSGGSPQHISLGSLGTYFAPAWQP